MTNSIAKTMVGFMDTASAASMTRLQTLWFAGDAIKLQYGSLTLSVKDSIDLAKSMAKLYRPQIAAYKADGNKIDNVDIGKSIRGFIRECIVTRQTWDNVGSVMLCGGARLVSTTPATTKLATVDGTFKSLTKKFSPAELVQLANLILATATK